MMAASSTSDGGKRILAHLEHGVRPAAKPARASGWTIDGWTVGLCVLLLLMCSVAWMMHEKTITPESFKHSESRIYQAAAAPRMDTHTAVAREQPAAIVNESTDAASASHADAADHYSAPQATGPSALQASSTDTPRVTVTAPTGLSREYKTPHAGAGTPPRASQTAQHAAAVRNAAVAGNAALAARDTDVALLTALVAHANKPTVTVAERSRDVVERQEGDTTAQLLARCQQLGVIEGMLCRSRICSGRWDGDAACRAPAQ